MPPSALSGLNRYILMAFVSDTFTIDDTFKIEQVKVVKKCSISRWKKKIHFVTITTQLAEGPSI